ncbi:thioredoxin [Blumeria hordei DH14]|uniref:Thioredoxin n=1 Tax=Blumeria graminis f. sp. hordei (strain DH14) TaxID=546991 RepID=N1JFU7_BLUG1|nr:thioredoxin [Blumeria hordei DH14]
MSKTVAINSLQQFNEYLQTSHIVVTDFYADWCGPCRLVAPLYEQLSAHLSAPKQITFLKRMYSSFSAVVCLESHLMRCARMPTFLVFQRGEVIEHVQGADMRKVQAIVQKLLPSTKDAPADATTGEKSTSHSSWRLGELPPGYHDVTDQVDLDGLDLSNADLKFGRARVLFDESKPTALQKGKQQETATKDWVESDSDEQLMLFIPFQSRIKIHSLLITSLPASSSTSTYELAMRPRTIKIYTNHACTLGFEEAEEVTPTQEITLVDSDWDESGTATICLRYVKFQNVSSIVLFIVDGDGSCERTRIDRLRLVGERGEKRDPGRLEKISHDD